MIRADGWTRYWTGEHSAALRDLYTRRCRDEAEEMTCSAQAAELLASVVSSGDEVLDVGCGTGWFFHSIRRRDIPVEYHGIDASPLLIEIARMHLPAFGVPAERVRVLRIEDMDGGVDHVVCLNVLSNIDNYHRPLERVLRCARKSVILRESCAETARYQYVRDPYLDPGTELKVHVNTYALSEFRGFIESYGFEVEVITDRRTGGAPEMVIGHPHHWTFFLARRAGGGDG
jgi:ubiquinone/menaquinone biosynthesis C-methylase UbiE